MRVCRVAAEIWVSMVSMACQVHLVGLARKVVMARCLEVSKAGMENSVYQEDVVVQADLDAEVCRHNHNNYHIITITVMHIIIYYYHIDPPEKP